MTVSYYMLLGGINHLPVSIRKHQNKLVAKGEWSNKIMSAIMGYGREIKGGGIMNHCL